MSVCLNAVYSAILAISIMKGESAYRHERECHIYLGTDIYPAKQ